MFFLGFPTHALSVVLFALLLWTGVGSLLTGRVRDRRRALTIALGAACLLMAASALWLRPLLNALVGLPFGARVVGFPIATLAAVLCYLVALLYARVQPWPEQATAPLREMGPVSEPQPSSGALTS